jgi:peptidylprolyl isomerase
VTFSTSGKPQVDVGHTSAPNKTRISLLRQGSGTKVKPDGEVIVQYQAVNMRTGKVFAETWDNGPATLAWSRMPPGFEKALTGQHVGSQIIALVPPTDGYGASGPPSADIDQDDTIIYVIDILHTTEN